ncbi:glycosyltransferase family 2 protein [Pseudomonas protegens]|nr:glycosyltransferase family 2 protein [Pseudomonas protegens]
MNESIKCPVGDGFHADVAIMMCTYNGAYFLAEQIKSFERQAYHNWKLYVSDDGSQDETVEIIKGWDGGRVRVYEGPRRGFSANFLSLTCRDEIKADFFAWSDQDDIWKENKLTKALDVLQKVPAHIPAIYCGRTELISDIGLCEGYSPIFRRAPHFHNALVQNIGGGNTMVFNQAARNLLQEAGADIVVPSHDWWAYQLVSGAGGAVFYDPDPTVFYRQHDNNLIGANATWLARIHRLFMVFDGRFCEWNTQNINALETMQHRLSRESLTTLFQFKALRRKVLPARLLGFYRIKLYRQTFLGNLGLVLAVLLKKI